MEDGMNFVELIGWYFMAGGSRKLKIDFPLVTCCQTIRKFGPI